MVTYNHEEFIAQAIDSVINQQTKYSFQLIIGDDCSTDNTGEVCRKFSEALPGKIRYIANKENVGLLKNYVNLFELCTAKYIAILEGDDYWHNKNKLEKQIDFLENNLAVGLVYTDADIITGNGTIIKNINLFKNRHTPEGNIYNYLLRKNCIIAGTTCFRKSLIDQHVKFEMFLEQNFITVDLPIWLSITRYANVKYFNESTITYRIHDNSISNSNEYGKRRKFLYGCFKIRSYFLDSYRMDNEVVHEEFLRDSLILSIQFRDFKAMKMLRKAIKKSDSRGLFLYIASSNKFVLDSASLFLPFLRQRRIMEQ